jgi:hemimethylated DNA binding protein
MRSLQFGLARQLLKRRDIYERELRPHLESIPRDTLSICRFISPPLLSVLEQPTTPNSATKEESERGVMKVRDLPTLLGSKDMSPATALETIRVLDKLQLRLQRTKYKSATKAVPYKFKVGDVVLHKTLHHIGVIAARFPVCLESDEWILQNIGSLTDPKLAHPWYLVLVAPHEGLPVDFMRYGSQLTHQKLEGAGSIGFHRMLPLFFKDYDPVQRRYVSDFPARVTGERRCRKSAAPSIIDIPTATPEVTVPAAAVHQVCNPLAAMDSPVVLPRRGGRRAKVSSKQEAVVHASASSPECMP